MEKTILAFVLCLGIFCSFTQEKKYKLEFNKGQLNAVWNVIGYCNSKT